MFDQSLSPLGLFQSYYPPLSEREPIPSWYIPLEICVIITGLATKPTLFSSTIMCSVFALLGTYSPYYTSGNAAQDYNTASLGFCCLLLYLDMKILSPAEGNRPRYVGRLGNNQTGQGLSDEDPKSWWQQLVWATRLLAPRGIGWNWQVKGVPPHPDADLPRLYFVAKCVLRCAYHLTLKAISLYVLGLCQGMQKAGTSGDLDRALSVVIGCCCGIWAWQGIQSVYSLASGLSTLAGVCDPWEWPPIIDSVGHAWSVRQMWSQAYHQIIRRTVQQPGIRLARLLGFKKGTFASKYSQLYVAFLLSFCIHWWQQFAVSRRDQGEFAFFLWQPVIISFEDLVQWAWGKCVGPNRGQALRRLEYTVGYVWVAACFAWTLRIWANNMVQLGICGGGGRDEQFAMAMGQSHGAPLLQAILRVSSS